MLFQKRDLLSYLIILALVVVSITSMSSIIDGITYPKVALGIFSVTALMPHVLKELQKKYDLKLLSKILLTLYIVFILFYIADDVHYRAVFGAPGRNNGLLSIFTFICFTVMGMYLKARNKLMSLLIALSILTSAISMGIILNSWINIKINVFYQFYDESKIHANIDMVGSLLLLGTISSIAMYKQAKSLLRKHASVIVVSNLCGLVSLNLLQSYLIFAVVVVLLSTTLSAKSNFIRKIPVITIIAYSSIIFLLQQFSKLGDSSIRERFYVLSLWPEVLNRNILLASKIDGITDLTRMSIPNQYVDDLHNFFLQISATYGLLFGVLMLVFFSVPFYLKYNSESKSKWLLPVYTSFYLTLFVGIFDPIYCYWGAVILGYLLGEKLVYRSKSHAFPRVSSLGVALMTLISILPITYIQFSDFYSRKIISDIFLDSASNGKVTTKDVNRLMSQIENVKDPNYRMIAIQNLSNIKLCALADNVREQMVEENPREIRLESIEFNSRGCLN